MTLSSVRRAAVALVLAFAALPSLVAAQATTGTVRGRVTDAASGRALADAQITVDGTRIGGITNANGDYTLNGVPAGSRAVTVRRIGYQPVTLNVTVGAGATATADAALKISAVNLSDVVVTGTGAPTERRKVGTSVASVDSALIS
ncbi:MAG TPA: carboxypeptidase-like regulatory domain-containing protein, partial [Gemmatimonadaceae bacterium]